ncbi:hypothetical protein D3C80_1630210 [compost metagenome]
MSSGNHVHILCWTSTTRYSTALNGLCRCFCWIFRWSAYFTCPFYSICWSVFTNQHITNAFNLITFFFQFHDFFNTKNVCICINSLLSCYTIWNNQSFFFPVSKCLRMNTGIVCNVLNGVKFVLVLCHLKFLLNVFCSLLP